MTENEIICWLVRKEGAWWHSNIVSVTTESPRGFIVTLFGELSECNAGEFIRKPKNIGHMKTIKWLHCNVTWWVVTQQQLQWLLSGVSEWQSLETTIETNKRYNILFYRSDYDISDYLRLERDVISYGCAVRIVLICFIWSLYYFLLSTHLFIN